MKQNITTEKEMREYKAIIHESVSVNMENFNFFFLPCRLDNFPLSMEMKKLHVA